MNEYIHLPLKEALQLKFERGRAKHRQNDQNEFRGDPIEELFQECLDAMNYCDEATRQGIDLSHRRSQFWATALELQSIHKNRQNANE